MKPHMLLGRAIAPLLTLLLASPPVQGQAAGCSDSAQEIFERGMRLLGTDRPGDAITLLEAAYFCQADPRTLYNLGAAYERVARYLLAVETYERYLRDRGTSVSDERAAEVRGHVERIRQRLGLVVLRRLPEGVTVSVGGHERSLFANGLYVDPGINVLEVRAEGRQSVRREIRLAAGGRVEVDLEMAEVAATTLRTPEGEVTFDVHPPNAEITLDGHLLGRGNLQRRVSEGRHVIEVRAQGFRPELRAVSIERGVVQQYAITLEPEARPDDGGITRRWWVWTIVGGVVLAGGVTATLWLTRNEQVGSATPGAWSAQVP